MLELNVSDVKQYVYCPRIVHYRYYLPLRRPTTYKMQEGKLQHVKVADLEERRTLRAYGLTEGQREFNVHLRSERLGLSGIIDMAILTGQEVIPVEHKNSFAQPGLNHKYQLVAYAMLCEEHWPRPARRGFVYLIPLKQAVEVPVTPAGRTFVRKALEEMRSMIVAERMPDPTQHRGRCVECEFRNFCNDIG